MVSKSPLCEDVDATVLEVGVKTFVGLPVVYVKTVDVVIISLNGVFSRLGWMMCKGLSLMGWFNSLLQTRLTNLSGETPFRCSANFSGNALIKDMIL